MKSQTHYASHLRFIPHQFCCKQVFAQPIFETAERWLQNGMYSLANRPVLMRVVVRCTYVALTCFVAILIPFFGDLMGYVASFACTGLITF